MQMETALLFDAIVRDNLPIDRLLDADFTFLNQELARHYQIDCRQWTAKCGVCH